MDDFKVTRPDFAKLASELVLADAVAIEAALRQVFQVGLAEGHDHHHMTPELTRTVIGNMTQTISHLYTRNNELHADKHALRIRPCHKCGAYPEIP